MKKTFKKTVESYPKARSQASKLGYVSTEERIKALLQAGTNLLVNRTDNYDILDPNPQEWELTPGRTFGLDLADLSELHREKAQRKREITQKIKLRRQNRNNPQGALVPQNPEDNSPASLAGTPPVQGEKTAVEPQKNNVN